MLPYLIRRLWQMIPTLLGVLLLVFLLFNWVGGDPAYVLAGKITNPEQIANIRRQLGIDEPLYVQLWIFLKQTVCFDFGNSWSTGESVSSIILSRLGPSLILLVPLTILETGLAIALGLAVAYVRGSLTDRMIMRSAFWSISSFSSTGWHTGSDGFRCRDGGAAGWRTCSGMLRCRY